MISVGALSMVSMVMVGYGFSSSNNFLLGMLISLEFNSNNFNFIFESEFRFGYWKFVSSSCSFGDIRLWSIFSVNYPGSNSAWVWGGLLECVWFKLLS